MNISGCLSYSLDCVHSTSTVFDVRKDQCFDFEHKIRSVRNGYGQVKFIVFVLSPSFVSFDVVPVLPSNTFESVFVVRVFLFVLLIVFIIRF